MDKYEFNIKVEQIKKLVNRGDYATAMKIADTIDWHRVRNASLLSMVAQVYEKNEEYQEAKDILLLAFERAPIGKRLLYKLTDLAIKEGSIPQFRSSLSKIGSFSSQKASALCRRGWQRKAVGPLTVSWTDVGSLHPSHLCHVSFSAPVYQRLLERMRH